jgi:hypothetical protein
MDDKYFEEIKARERAAMAQKYLDSLGGDPS